MPRLTVSFDDDLYHQISSFSDERGVSKSEIVRNGMGRYLASDEGVVKSDELLEQKDKKIELLGEKKQKLKDKVEDKEEVICSKDETLKEKNDRIEDYEDKIRELNEELQGEKEETATFGEWVTSINPLARFFIKAGLMVSGWNIPERVKEEQE